MASTSDAARDGTDATRSLADRRFWLVMGGILLVAFVVRVAFVQMVTRHDERAYDALYYELQADANAGGQFFQVPAFFPLPPGPAADHPPMTALVLTPAAMVKRIDNQILMRYTTLAFGLGAVAVIGLVGREIGGARAGWVAAALAAVYPNLWVNDGLIMSESLAALLTASAVLLAYRLARSRTVGLAIALGAICGLAALTRAELLLLAPLFVVPLVLTDSATRPARERWLPVGIALGTCVAVLLPWFVWNTVRFDRPVAISTNEGIALLGSNCDPVYSGDAIGGTNLGCLPDPRPAGDQSVESAEFRAEALRYIADNLTRFPAVLGARLGRTWSVFRPLDALTINQTEGRPQWVSGLGLAFYYPLLLLAVGGVVALVRAGKSIWPLLVPAIVVTLGMIPAYGRQRFRVPAEPSLVVLAAVALVAIAGWMIKRAADRRAASDSDPDPMLGKVTTG